MEAKHTQGPWITNCGFVATAKHTAICKMSYTGAVKFAADPASLEDSANARLIAAAPDMLEACKAVLEANPIPGGMKERRGVMAMVEAAIQAATGE